MGHMQCGKKGCIEVLASGTAIARRAREKLAESPQRGGNFLLLRETMPLPSAAKWWEGR